MASTDVDMLCLWAAGDPDGDVVFATATLVKHQVFNGPPHMN
jgi:hypothetical protein